MPYALPLQLAQTFQQWNQGQPRQQSVTQTGVRLAEETGDVRAEAMARMGTREHRQLGPSHRVRGSRYCERDRLVEHGRIAVAYNHPQQDDDLAVLIVTLWRRA